jgi:predicted deacetylase
MSVSKQKQTPLAVVTVHDACPFFSRKIFKFADELEKLGIMYNIALVPFFNEKQDLPSFPEFVDKIKSYKGCEIALHGLYHEKKMGDSTISIQQQNRLQKRKYVQGLRYFRR